MGAKALHTPNFSHPFKPDTPTGTRPQHLMQLPPKRQWPQGNEHAGLENRKVVEVPQEQGQGAASCCAKTLEITNPRPLKWKLTPSNCFFSAISCDQLWFV
jgi:hypothetical protein